MVMRGDYFVCKKCLKLLLECQLWWLFRSSTTHFVAALRLLRRWRGLAYNLQKSKTWTSIQKQQSLHFITCCSAEKPFHFLLNTDWRKGATYKNIDDIMRCKFLDIINPSCNLELLSAEWCRGIPAFSFASFLLPLFWSAEMKRNISSNSISYLRSCVEKPRFDKLFQQIIFSEFTFCTEVHLIQRFDKLLHRLLIWRDWALFKKCDCYCLKMFFVWVLRSVLIMHSNTSEKRKINGC